MGNAHKNVMGTFDLDSSVKDRYLRDSFHVWKQEGTPVQRWHRSRLTLIWCLWIIFAGGASALACVSRPANHAGAHPLLCMDSSNPTEQGYRSPMLLAEGRRLRSPSKVLISVVYRTALGSLFVSILDVLAHELSWPQEGILASTPAVFQPALRL